ncbi:MAG: hypothetical protein L0I76_27210, partial [Pseudonocardia sp.]|nr:hypothetical protein [Pseudonocardia sp.]
MRGNGYASIAAFFPVFGACVMHACGTRDADWGDASAVGLTSTLLVGVVFYDIGKFQFFVPCMVVLLAVFLLMRSPGL